jgi:hypothetical protein
VSTAPCTPAHLQRSWRSPLGDQRLWTRQCCWMSSACRHARRNWPRLTSCTDTMGASLAAFMQGAPFMPVCTPVVEPAPPAVQEPDHVVDQQLVSQCTSICPRIREAIAEMCCGSSDFSCPADFADFLDYAAFDCFPRCKNLVLPYYDDCAARAEL